MMYRGAPWQPGTALESVIIMHPSSPITLLRIPLDIEFKKFGLPNGVESISTELPRFGVKPFDPKCML